MVTFTPDSKKILSADEGEPRNGYEAGSIDPKGTVTVIDLTNDNVPSAPQRNTARHPATE